MTHEDETSDLKVSLRLPPDALRRLATDEEVDLLADNNVSPSLFGDDIFVGMDQKRLHDALTLGLNATSKDHIFVTGLGGPRVLGAVKKYVENVLRERENILKERRANIPQPPDWVYLYNFENPLEPIVIALEKGRGTKLKERIQKIATDLREKIPARLTSDDFIAERQQINLVFQDWVNDTRREIHRSAREKGIYVEFGERGNFFVGILSRKKPAPKEGSESKIILDALRVLVSDLRSMESKGGTAEVQNQTETEQQSADQAPEAMAGEEWDALPSDQKESLVQLRNEYLGIVTRHFTELGRRERKRAEDVEELTRARVTVVVDEIFAAARLTSAKTTGFAERLKQHTINHYRIFNSGHEQNDTQGSHENQFLPWEVNVFVDHSSTPGLPVVVDMEGTFQSLLGRIDHVGGSHGLVYTDHTMIRPGSLAQANHGFLIVDGLSFRKNPGAYEVIKRSLTNKMLQVEDYSSFYGMGSGVPIQPQSIPLNVKAIVVGPRWLWSMLAHYDPEFLGQFGLKAEVAPFVDRIPEETQALASWMHIYAAKEGLREPDKSALKKLVEHSGRLAESKMRLATSYDDLEAVLREASIFAEQEKSLVVTSTHVKMALDAKFFRSNLGYEYRQRAIREGHLLLPLRGEKVGQITALSYVDFGDIRVGFPGRLAASWSLGRPGFMSIKREAKLAGQSLEEEEYTVQAYFNSLFAQRQFLSMLISYTFEQSQGGLIDGPSAGLALFYVISSAVARVAINAGIGITASLGIHGAIQPIGGVNEKIEGLFDACIAAGGLTGTQGTIISRINSDGLMLREDVVEAAEKGMFNVWALDRVEEGVPILMGIPAGSPDENGSFPLDTLFGKVELQIASAYTMARKLLGSQDQGSGLPVS